MDADGRDYASADLADPSLACLSGIQFLVGQVKRDAGRKVRFFNFWHGFH